METSLTKYYFSLKEYLISDWNWQYLLVPDIPVKDDSVTEYFVYFHYERAPTAGQITATCGSKVSIIVSQTWIERIETVSVFGILNQTQGEIRLFKRMVLGIASYFEKKLEYKYFPFLSSLTTINLPFERLNAFFSFCVKIVLVVSLNVNIKRFFQREKRVFLFQKHFIGIFSNIWG